VAFGAHSNTLARCALPIGLNIACVARCAVLNAARGAVLATHLDDVVDVLRRRNLPNGVTFPLCRTVRYGELHRTVRPVRVRRDGDFDARLGVATAALTHLERREIGDIVAVRPLSNLERRRGAVTYSFTDSFARVGCLALHRYTGPDAHEDKRVKYAHTGTHAVCHTSATVDALRATVSRSAHTCIWHTAHQKSQTPRLRSHEYSHGLSPTAPGRSGRAEGSAELTRRAELGLGAGLGQQVPDGLIVHLDLRHRTQCSGHEAHDTVAKVRPRGIDQWRIRGV
jgi:uncharacterized membrane protein